MLVFINGMHRSGTMLLSRLTNALPDVFIVKDGFRLPWYYLRVELNEKVKYPLDFYRSYPRKIDFNRRVKDCHHLRQILASEFKSMKFSTEINNDLFTTLEQIREGISYKKSFEMVFKALTRSSSSKHIGSKMTHMNAYASEMLRNFPDMKWIEIIRDSRGWYCSTKVSHPTNIIASARLWNNAITSAKRNLEAFSNRYKVITYEDLGLNKNTVLQEICNFLDIDFKVTEEWLNNLRLQENDGTSWHANPSYRKNGAQVFGDQNQLGPNEYKVLDQTPVFRWQKVLTHWEKKTLNMMTGKNLRRFNFAIDPAKKDHS